MTEHMKLPDGHNPESFEGEIVHKLSTETGIVKFDKLTGGYTHGLFTDETNIVSDGNCVVLGAAISGIIAVNGRDKNPAGETALIVEINSKS